MATQEKAKGTVLSLRLNEKDWMLLKALSEREDSTVSDLLRDAVRQMALNSKATTVEVIAPDGAKVYITGATFPNASKGQSSEINILSRSGKGTLAFA